jgi:hypothetical protein
LRDESAPPRKNSYADPATRLAPDRVTTLIWPAPLRPKEASYVEVRTWNSRIPSTGGRTLGVFSFGSTL